MKDNKQSIIRLSRYKTALTRLKSLGFSRIYSPNLADAIGVTPSQVRKDFSLFRLSGNKRGGYSVDDLLAQLKVILGKNEIHRVIIVGVGNIGTALMRYQGFEKEGIKIIAGFDIDPLTYTQGQEVPVYPLDAVGQMVREQGIKIGIIAVPDYAAQQTLDLMMAAGIKGVLNFAPLRLRALADVVVTNVNLVMELENVIYFSMRQTNADTA
jgi:redox-sensing transcriptional repressor